MGLTIIHNYVGSCMGVMGESCTLVLHPGWHWQRMCPSGSPLLEHVLAIPRVIKRTLTSGGVTGGNHRSDLRVAGACCQVHLTWYRKALLGTFYEDPTIHVRPTVPSPYRRKSYPSPWPYNVIEETLCFNGKVPIHYSPPFQAVWF